MAWWITATAWLEWGVMALLFILSIWSVTIMVDRKKAIQKLDLEDLATLKTALRENSNLGAVEAMIQDLKSDSLAGRALKMLLTSSKQNPSSGLSPSLDRMYRSFASDERASLERGLSVLATLGANAPFIGLFGTVLGIIRAFAALGGQSSGAAATSVMSGISQALFVTAAGLFVAIPAVLAYNTFSTRIRAQMAECESLKDLFVARFGR